MSESDALQAQAKFLVQLHGQNAQTRLINEIKSNGEKADSPYVRRLKLLLRAVTTLLNQKAA